jgi:hypothetical protein
MLIAIRILIPDKQPVFACTDIAMRAIRGRRSEYWLYPFVPSYRPNSTLNAASGPSTFSPFVSVVRRT